MQCQNNTVNQIMMNEGKKCCPPSQIICPHTEGGGKNVTGRLNKKLCVLWAQLDIFCPPWQKTYSPPLILHQFTKDLREVFLMEKLDKNVFEYLYLSSMSIHDCKNAHISVHSLHNTCHGSIFVSLSSSF